MVADDLFRFVALDPLRPRIPAGDIALRGEEVDRVVGDALHQQLKLFLALAQLGLGRPALRQVARDLGIAQQPAIAVADGIDDDICPEAAAVLTDAPAFRLELALALRCLKRLFGKRVARSSSV